VNLYFSFQRDRHLGLLEVALSELLHGKLGACRAVSCQIDDTVGALPYFFCLVDLQIRQLHVR